MTIDCSAVERLGYSVAVNDGDAGTDFPYVIHGQRGAKYGLMRNVHNPHHLFAVNMRRFTAQARVGGYEWFSDDNGALRPLR